MSDDPWVRTIDGEEWVTADEYEQALTEMTRLRAELAERDARLAVLVADKCIEAEQESGK